MIQWHSFLEINNTVSRFANDSSIIDWFEVYCRYQHIYLASLLIPSLIMFLFYTVQCCQHIFLLLYTFAVRTGHLANASASSTPAAILLFFRLRCSSLTLLWCQRIQHKHELSDRGRCSRHAWIFHLLFWSRYYIKGYLVELELSANPTSFQAAGFTEFSFLHTHLLKGLTGSDAWSGPSHIILLMTRITWCAVEKPPDTLVVEHFNWWLSTGSSWCSGFDLLRLFSFSIHLGMRQSVARNLYSPFSRITWRTDRLVNT